MSKLSQGWILQKRERREGDPSLAGPIWVYGTLILCWLLDLLPWGSEPMVPSCLYLSLVFWSIYRPERMYFLLVFLLGILVDAGTGAVFGQNALIFCTAVFITQLMSLRLQWLSGIGQALNLIPVFLLPTVILTAESLFLGDFTFSWTWLAKAGVSVVIWPIWSWLLSGSIFSHRE